MSLGDWIGVVLLTPLLLALATLVVYLVIGMIGSGARRRRHARQQAAAAREVEGKVAAVPRRRAPSQSPGD